MTPSERVETWLQEAVIGLNLCPFAASPYRMGTVRIQVSSSVDFDACMRDFLVEVEYLLDHPRTSTTVLVFAFALVDFEEFLDAGAIADSLLDDAGLDGVFQVATFHPNYVFADADPEDVTNWTNRAPLPILHLIRESEVTQALEKHDDPEGIPETNMQAMRDLGPAELEKLWARWRL